MNSATSASNPLFSHQEDIFRLPRNVILSDTFVSLVRHYREYAANSLAKRSARGMGNVGFGAGSASSEPVLALFPRLAGDPALMMVGVRSESTWYAERECVATLILHRVGRHERDLGQKHILK